MTTTVRIALANLRFPADRDDSVALATRAIAGAGAAGAQLVAFPECYVPGYRCWPGRTVAPPDEAFLARAWAALGEACATAKITAAVGTERFVDGRLYLTVIVLGPDGGIVGFQDKVQLDPSEDATYTPGTGRRVFQAGAAGELTFGISICHEGFRYPETVRWAVRQGAQLVLHPHYSAPEAGEFQPTTFADARNSFHEKAVLCRAAENTCWVATINAATAGSPTTSAVARPDGTVLAWQPYGQEGLLIADLELALATRRLAERFRVGAY